MGDPTTRRPALLHPLTLGALALLLVNDHVLKTAWPGWWTGKLSDVAALIVAPVALAAVGGWAVRLGTGPDRPDDGRMSEVVGLSAALAVAALFIGAKLTPEGNGIYASLVGVLAWPLAVAGAVLAGRPIPALGPAPTVLDPSDLLALPAVVVGARLALGGARPGRTIARVAVASGAWLALAATSAIPPPPTLTSTIADATSLTADTAPVERRATVTVGTSQRSDPAVPVDPALSVRIQARPRWPPNAPPARFTVIVDGVGQASGPAPVVAAPPSRCWSGCTLEVTVAIDWPGGTGSTTVAWELVATTDVTGRGQGQYSGAAPGVMVASHDLSQPTAEPNLGLLALVCLPLLGSLLGGTVLRRRLAGRRSRLRWPDVVVVVTATLAGAIVVVGIAVCSTPGMPLDTNPWIVPTAGLLALAALTVGSIAWLLGSGAILAVTVIDLALVAIPVGAALTGASAGVFADRGIAATVALAAVLSVLGMLAAARLPEGDPVATGERLTILAIGLAVAVGIGFGSAGSLNGLTLLAFLQVLAMATWWAGSGWILGITSLASAGVAALALVANGPGYPASGGWTSTDRITQVAILLGSLVGLLAAFRQIGRHPDTLKPKRKDTARIEPVPAASPPPADGGPEPPPTT